MRRQAIRPSWPLPPCAPYSIRTPYSLTHKSELATGPGMGRSPRQQESLARLVSRLCKCICVQLPGLSGLGTDGQVCSAAGPTGHRQRRDLESLTAMPDGPKPPGSQIRGWVGVQVQGSSGCAGSAILHKSSYPAILTPLIGFKSNLKFVSTLFVLPLLCCRNAPDTALWCIVPVFSSVMGVRSLAARISTAVSATDTALQEARIRPAVLRRACKGPRTPTR